LVDGVAIVIYCILFASNAFRDDCCDFVSDETIDSRVRIRDEVKAMNRELLQTICSTCQLGNVFFEAVVGGRVVCVVEPEVKSPPT
jgi:hypothetical protein